MLFPFQTLPGTQPLGLLSYLDCSFYVLQDCSKNATTGVKRCGDKEWVEGGRDLQLYFFVPRYATSVRIPAGTRRLRRFLADFPTVFAAHNSRRQGLHGDANHRHHPVLGFRHSPHPGLFPASGRRVRLGPHLRGYRERTDGDLRPVPTPGGGAGWGHEAEAQQRM